MKKMFIVATPIGNLNEINQRAIDAFNASEIVFCENTSVTKKLFTLLNINFKDKKFIAINKFNENSIVDKLNFYDDKLCCLTSDAGYPIISDPGYYLINKVIENNINIEVINGSCSIIHALVISGFKNKNFYFNGFLSSNKNEKKDELNYLKTINSTLIIFESVHKIINTLQDIKLIFGEDVNIAVVKELTKVNETIYRGNINEIINKIDLRGEFIILIDNNDVNKNNSKENDLSIYLDEVNKIIKKGTQAKLACKMVAYKYDISSNMLFDTLQRQKNII